jgi:SAM-dependent methyltransferase
VDNVHEIAQAIHPDARVVYSDVDPIVLAHGRALLEQNENTAVLQADFRDVDSIWESDEVKRLIRMDEPIAALFVSVLHCIKDRDDPAGVVRRVREKLPPGSYLVVCQLVSDDPETRRSVTEFMAESTGDNWGRVRTPQDVHSYLEGLELLDPGLVEVSTWRADNELAPKQPSKEWIEFGGVARLT